MAVIYVPRIKHYRMNHETGAMRHWMSDRLDAYDTFNAALSAARERLAKSKSFEQRVENMLCVSDTFKNSYVFNYVAEFYIDDPDEYATKPKFADALTPLRVKPGKEWAIEIEIDTLHLHTESIGSGKVRVACSNGLKMSL